MSQQQPIPLAINLHKKSRRLEVEFNDGKKYEFSCEFLRVHSPSADVKGHGPGQGVLQVGKENVGIESIEPVGNYGIKLRFDDGHDTGIYSWSYLYDMGMHRDEYWQDYLYALKQAGHKHREH